MRWEFALQFDSKESYSTVLLSFREYTRYKLFTVQSYILVYLSLK